MLRVAGEIDLRGHAALHAALEDGLRAALGHLVVDLSTVTFCSVRGFCLIADAASAAAAAGTDFVVSGLPARLKRIALLAWDDRVPRLLRTADDAGDRHPRRADPTQLTHGWTQLTPE